MTKIYKDHEEFWAEYLPIHNTKGTTKDAWDAAIASMQAEIEVRNKRIKELEKKYNSYRSHVTLKNKVW